MGIAENIKELRRRYDLTQAELGEIAGVSDKAVSTWEKGTAEPRMGAVQKMAEHFGITKGSIIDDRVPNDPRYAAAAGEGIYSDGSPTDTVSLHLEADQKLVLVKGRSMEPTLHDGDTVVVSAQSILDYPRQIALVKVNGEDHTIKRVEIKDDGLLLLADNIDVYPPHFYTEKEVQDFPVTIEGVVVKLIREI